MPEWLIVYLGSLQAGVMRGLAAEFVPAALAPLHLAFTLGAVHALTPGHGKAALAAYFLGREARIGKGRARGASGGVFARDIRLCRVPRASPLDRSVAVDLWSALADVHLSVTPSSSSPAS